MNKSDYDKYYKKGGTYVIPVELFNELFDELERLSINYGQALEDLDKKDNIINELEKWLDINLFNLEKEKANNTYDKGLKQGMLSNGRLIKNKLQELKGSEKE